MQAELGCVNEREGLLAALQDAVVALHDGPIRESCKAVLALAELEE